MIQVYQFKTTFKRRTGLWRRIEIRGDQTLGDFDQILRDTFNHDPMDHLSEFFRGRPWQSEGFGEINPFEEGEGVRRQICTLGLSENDKLEYVYDFGDNIQHIITLEKIGDLEEGVEYPRIISQNKTRYRYCETCRRYGRKTRATWICIKCTKEKELLLCEDCLMKEHEDHYAKEMVY